MNDFPKFMKNPVNQIATTDQATPGFEGDVFDGADGSQMAFWTCGETATSAAHVHNFDEYLLVVRGCYTLIINGQRIPLTAGMEYSIRRGTPHAGGVVAGTRTIHAFGGHRADRQSGCRLRGRRCDTSESSGFRILVSGGLECERLCNDSDA